MVNRGNEFTDMAKRRINNKLPQLSVGEETFALHLRAAKLSYIRQFKFDAVRKWQFDFADLASRVVLDIQGGVWTNGAHVRGKGITNDCEKYSRATVAGYRVLLATTEQVLSAEAFLWWISVVESVKASRNVE